MSDRPEEFRYESGYALVVQSYDTWHVDLETVDGGLIQRAIVIGHRLPEPSTKARPQWVQYAFADHDHSQAFCTPVNSRMPGDRTDRRAFLFYDEVGNYRITVDRDGQYEVRNSKGDVVLQLRILEDGGVIETRTPNTSIVQDDSAKSVTINAGETATINCKNATVHADENIDAQAGGDVTVQAGGDASVTASGSISMTGALISLNG
ncbi:MAG: hypothetical protein ABI629_12420 [bacterium]